VRVGEFSEKGSWIPQYPHDNCFSTHKGKKDAGRKIRREEVLGLSPTLARKTERTLGIEEKSLTYIDTSYTGREGGDG